MASSKAYLEFVLEQLSNLEGITYRYMMSEYILYYKTKIVGGIYDDRFLVKPIESAKKYLNELIYETQYPGGKEMLLVDNIDNREYICGLLEVMYDELPYPKVKQGKKKA